MTDTNNDKSVYSEEQIKQDYKKLLEDSDFDDLEAELRKPNIFSILGIGRMEIRHSNFLAWLLDPNESHGLGNRVLIRVLRDLALDDKNDLDIFKINELNFSNVEVNREVPISLKDEDGSIDILIVFRDDKDKLLICIENKIDTTDFDGQLKKYRTYIKNTFKKENERDDGYKHIFVYLTPNRATHRDAEEIEWINYTYKNGIIKHLENIEKTIADSIIKTYISDYLSTLKREIMGNKETSIEDMANSIYNDHKAIFKFVFDNKSNELYRMDWEKYDWVINCAESLKKVLKQIDDEIDNELGFTQTYISIKRNNQICYEFYSRETKPNCSMAFAFDKTRKDCIDPIKRLLLDVKPLKSGSYLKKDKYFSIPNVNEFIDKHSDVLQEIHKIRFPNQPTDNPDNQ